MLTLAKYFRNHVTNGTEEKINRRAMVTQQFNMSPYLYAIDWPE